ncbi:MAG: SLBB domain-containing protein [Phycisphaerae bacterium]
MAMRRDLMAACGTLWAGSLALLLAGCAALPPNSFIDPTKVGQFPAEYRERGIRRVLTPREGPLGLANATEPRPEDGVPRFEEYRIAAGDAIGVGIEDFFQPGLQYQAQFEVAPSGAVRVPQLGVVKVVGMSEPEMEQELRSRIQEAGILRDPVVQAFIATRRQQTFSVIGSIRNPGVYPISAPDTRLLDAIGLAGDIGAGIRKIYIIRQEARPGGDAAAAPAATDPAQPQTEREPLVIPVDDDADFQGTMFAGGGAQDREAAPASQESPRREELEEVLNPSATSSQPGTAPTDGDRKFQPLVFDPQGEAKEAAPPSAEPVRPSDSPSAPQSPTVTPRLPDATDKPFDWEAEADATETQRVIEVDVGALKSGDPRANLVIRNKDVINIPVDTGVFYMMGEVSRPGVFGFNEREITLKQAVATVGGFTPLAWPQRVEIIRREKGTDKQLTIPVNLDAIFAGMEDDILLRDDDIVNVGTHFVAPFLFVIRNSFRFTYGFGFVYDRNFADRDSYGGKINPQTLAIDQQNRRGLPF